MNHHSGAKLAPVREAYLSAAGSWADDMQASLARSRRTAWWIAGVAVAIAGLEAVALASLAPLKTSVPYAFVVDRQTGYIEAATKLQAGPLTQDGAVTRSNLVRYVLARETYDWTDIRDNYRRTVQWSAGPARTAYVQTMRPTNPQSPVKAYPRTAVVKVTVKGVSLLGPGSALVRFDAERTDGAQRAAPVPYAAVIGFRYNPAAKPMAERLDNPLGFEVTSYRRDLETVAPRREEPAS